MVPLVACQPKTEKAPFKNGTFLYRNVTIVGAVGLHRLAQDVVIAELGEGFDEFLNLNDAIEFSF